MTSITSIYLWQGFTSSGPIKGDEIEVYSGETGAATAITDWADRLDACDPLFEGLNFAGVFEYEVTEAIGAMLRPFQCLVNETTLHEAADLLAKWFHPSDESEQANLRTACHAAMKGAKQ